MICAHRFALCSALLLASCEQSTDPSSSPEGADAATFDAGGASAAFDAGSFVLDSEGGTLSVGSITVTFQPESVIDVIEVGLRVVDPEELELPSEVHSEIFELTPFGTLLDRPALIRIVAGTGVEAPVLVLLTREEGGLQARVALAQLSPSNSGGNVWESAIEEFGVGYIADATELQTLEVFKDDEVVAQAITISLAPTSTAPGADAGSAPSTATSSPENVSTAAPATGDDVSTTSAPDESETPTSESNTSSETSAPFTDTSTTDADAGAGCPPGTFIVASEAQPTAIICQPCGQGYFSDEPNSLECSPWQVCMPGEVPLNQPSTTLDRACGTSELEMTNLVVAVNGNGIVNVMAGIVPVTLDSRDSVELPLGTTVTLTALAAGGHVLDTLVCVGQPDGPVRESETGTLSLMVDGPYNCSATFVEASGVPVRVTMSEVGGYVNLEQSSQVCSASINDGPGDDPETVTCTFETAVGAALATLVVNVESGYQLTSVGGYCEETETFGVYEVFLGDSPACDVTFGECLPEDVGASFYGPEGLTFEPNQDGVLEISWSYLVEVFGDTTLTMSASILGDQVPESMIVLVDGDPTFYGEGGETFFDTQDFARDTVVELTVQVPWCDTNIIAPQIFRIMIVN